MNLRVLKENNLFRDFAKYVSLNVFSMIGLSFYILADTLYIANGIGSHGLTALNLAIPVFSFISGVGLMIGMGSATRYSIFRGENEKNKANKTFTHAIYISIGIAFILTFLGVFFSYEIAEMLGANKEVISLVNEYLRVILMFSCAFIMNNVLICFVRNDNNPKLAMIAMLVASFSNVILDYIFIFPMNLGIFGAALATGFAPIFSMCVLSIHFIKKRNKFKLVKCRLETKYIKNIFSLGVPSFITEFSSGIIMLIFNFIILNIKGNIGIAAYGIIANLALIVVAIFTGIGQGIQPLISANYGAGKTYNIKKIYIWALILTTGFGVMTYIIGISFPQLIVGIFNRENDMLLEQISISGIKLYFVAFFVMGANIITTSFFSSIDKPIKSFSISITRGFVAIVPLVIILSQFMGMTGVWISVPLAEFITLGISIYNVIAYYKIININKESLSVKNSIINNYY
jgi:putative MATE family efflux protein